MTVNFNNDETIGHRGSLIVNPGKLLGTTCIYCLLIIREQLNLGVQEKQKIKKNRGIFREDSNEYVYSY